MPSGTGIAPPRCHPPPDGGTLRHVNNSLPGPLSKGSVHGNGSRQPDNWLSALAEPFVTVLAHGNGGLSHSDWTSRSDVIREKAENKIVPIAIGVCQVPPIDYQYAPSSFRDRNTSIGASPIPIAPAVRTLLAKRLKIRIVPIGMCQVPPIGS